VTEVSALGRSAKPQRAVRRDPADRAGDLEARKLPGSARHGAVEGTEQVVDSIEQIRVMVQQNAESASELASSSEELSRQASLMRELTSRFHVSVNGMAPTFLRAPATAG
jgi:hypothetical protein